MYWGRNHELTLNRRTDKVSEMGLALIEQLLFWSTRLTRESKTPHSRHEISK